LNFVVAKTKFFSFRFPLLVLIISLLLTVFFLFFLSI